MPAASILLTLALAGAPATPAEIVNVLVEAPHGMTSMSGAEVLAAFERFKADPAPYVPHLLSLLDEGQVRTADRSSIIRSANAAGLLAQGNADGRRRLREKLVAFQATRDALRAAQNAARKGLSARPSAAELAPLLARENELENLIRVERSAVSAFSALRNLELRDLLLSRVESDADLQSSYVAYFEAASKADAEVRARLKGLLESRRVPGLAPQLERFLSSSAARP